MVNLHGSAQLLHGGWDVLEWQEGHSSESAVLLEELIVEEVVVGAAEFDRILRVTDLADVHEAGRIENGQLYLPLVEFFRPLAPIRHSEVLLSVVVLGNRAVPAVMRHQGKIEHRLPPRPVARRHIFYDLLVRLAYVTIRIDDVGRILCVPLFHERLLTYVWFFLHRVPRFVNASFDKGALYPFASQTLAATAPEFPWGARLRLRPMGQCLAGRHPKPLRALTPMFRACTEPSRPYVRSLTHAPLGISPRLPPQPAMQEVIVESHSARFPREGVPVPKQGRQ